MLYKPAKVTPVGDTAVLNTAEFVDGGDSRAAQPSVARAGLRGQRDRWRLRRGRQPPQDQGLRVRPCPTPVTARATATRARTVCREGPARPGWRPTRPAPATRTCSSSATSTPTPRRTRSSPSRTPGYTNLVETYLGAGRLLLRRSTGSGATSTTPSGRRRCCSQVTGVAEYHINADEPSVLDYNTDFKTADLRSQPLRAGRVPRLRPRPGHRRPVAELAPLGAAAFADDSVSVRRRQREPHRDITDRGSPATPTRRPSPGATARASTVDPAAASPLTLHAHLCSAGRYTATVTVTDSPRPPTYSTTAEIAVEYTSSGILAAARVGRTAKLGSTVPVKVAYTDCDGSVPTDLDAGRHRDAGRHDARTRARRPWSRASGSTS